MEHAKASHLCIGIARLTKGLQRLFVKAIIQKGQYWLWKSTGVFQV